MVKRPKKKATIWVIGDLRDDINEVLNGADSAPVRYPLLAQR